MSLPRGWARVCLGGVCERVEKWDPRKSPSAEFDYVDIGAIDRQRITRSTRLLGGDAPSRARQLVRSGDTILSTVRTYLVNTALVSEEFDGATVSTGFCVLRPTTAIDPKFLFYRVIESAFVAELSEAQTGSSYPAVRDADVFAQRVGLPPLAEQRRIVAAIEEQLSRLDAATELLGRSTQRSHVLVDAQIRALIDDTDWPLIPLSQSAELITDGDHNPPPRVGSGVPHLTAKNIRNGEIRVEGCTFVSPEGFRQTRKRYDPKPGDVIVTCVGTIGESAVVPEGLTFSADRNLAALRPAADFDASYLRFALSSERQRQLMLEASGSTAQPHLYLRDLRALRVPAPPLERQKAIASTLAAEVARVGQLGAAVGVARRRAESLRRSILASAFRGELVPQDPNDEPASFLLERVAVERAAAPKPPRKRRETTRA